MSSPWVELSRVGAKSTPEEPAQPIVGASVADADRLWTRVRRPGTDAFGGRAAPVPGQAIYMATRGSAAFR
jgi:hypothetical protein